MLWCGARESSQLADTEACAVRLTRNELSSIALLSLAVLVHSATYTNSQAPSDPMQKDGGGLPFMCWFEKGGFAACDVDHTSPSRHCTLLHRLRGDLSRTPLGGVAI